MKSKKDRGRIVPITLKRAILFNSLKINEALIEIDHINHGLDDKGNLKKSKRTNFTIADIEKFLMLLDGEYVLPTKYKGKISQYEVRIDCPIKGPCYGKQFIMIFDIHYDVEGRVHTITIYPGW